MKNMILFGAGKNGLSALERFGESVAYFCDNNSCKHGKFIQGIEVIDFNKLLELYKCGYKVIVTPINNSFIIAQLEENGIYDYEIFIKHYEGNVFEYFESITLSKKENSRILDEYVNKTDKLDLLSDVSEFKKLTKEVMELNRQKQLCLHKWGINSEGLMYGNTDILLEYGHIPADEQRYFPCVSHQCVFPLYSVGFQYNHAVIFQGEYFKKKIQKRFPYIPVFSVGPYINYAKEMYNDKEKLEMKDKIGKMLLVFLPHTIENIKRQYDKKDFIDSVIRKYNKIYDTIWMCSYWADINDSACDYAESRGIHIVSAGFRFDRHFNNRLKTIISLSDAVVCGDIGSFIMYSLYMNKPVYRLPISENDTISDYEFKSDFEKKYQFGEEYISYKTKFYEIFNENTYNIDIQKQWSETLAGYNLIKTPDEIKNIHIISKDIWEACDGIMKYYSEAIHSVYKKYQENNETEKILLLKDAVGIYLNK